MSLPDVPRVLYAKAPLEQVICQLRFPTILKINLETPVDFQERLRKQYPLFEQKSEVTIPQQLLQQLPPTITETLLKIDPINVYIFSSSDKNWMISLTRDFLSIQTSKYERWEDLKKHLEEPLKALIDIYNPVFFVRVGLRYQDIIRRSKLGQEKSPWSKLLQPYIAGALDSKLVANSIQEIGQQLIIQLDEFSAKVRIQHGLVQDEKGETCYLIDNDFFSENQTEVNNATAILDYFNQQNRLFFRWFITEQLHKAMGPKTIGDDAV